MTYANYNCSDHDGFRFEEADDPRTWNGSIISDCMVGDQRYESLASLALYQKNFSKVDEYWEKFRSFLKACGRISYCWTMEKKLLHPDYSGAKRVAAEYGHDLEYYRTQKKANIRVAKVLFSNFLKYAPKVSLTIQIDRDGFNDLLKGMIANKDRRNYVYHLVAKSKSDGVLLTPSEIEARYQDCLKKRCIKKRLSS